MSSVTVQLPVALEAKLNALAKRQQTSRQAAMRDALAAFALAEPLSAVDLAGHLAGAVVDPPVDVLTAPQCMEACGE